MWYSEFYKVGLVCFLMVVQAAADGKITVFSIVDDPVIAPASTEPEGGSGEATAPRPSKSIVLTIETVVGNEYQVQETVDLMAGAWASVNNAFVATENTTTVAFSESDAYFFRVVVTPRNNPVMPPPPPPPPPPPEG